MVADSVRVRRAVDKILFILRELDATPESVRYVFKKVREKGKFQVPVKKSVLKDFLNDAEIDHCLFVAMQLDVTTSVLAHTAVFTGLRIKELCFLRVDDVDFVNRQLSVREGAKFGKHREVPLKPALAQHLKSYIGVRKSGYVFVKGNNTQYSIRALQYKLEKLFDKCAFNKDLSAHSLRHTFATLCRRNGMSLQDIQGLLGHDRIETVQIYARMELGSVKDEFIKKLGFE